MLVLQTPHVMPASWEMPPQPGHYNDGGTRESLHYWQLPVSGEVNISEISDRLFVMASSMKGVEE